MEHRQLTDERVEKALESARRDGEEGLQVAAYLGDELIVNTWAGEADSETGRLVDGATLFQIFSVTKALVATALHVQAERGLIDYDLPVARYWPEFGQRGKERITVRDALTHRTGIPMMPQGVTPEKMYDWEWMISQIERFRPWFPAGAVNSYHVLVWGWIVGEVVRRTDRSERTLRQFILDEVCAPLGITDFHLGLEESEHHRVTKLDAEWEVATDPDHLREAAMPVAVAAAPPLHNLPATWSACLPGDGAIANAESVARLFAMLANGGCFRDTRLLAAQRVESFRVPRRDTALPDVMLEAPVWVGEGGYWLGGDLARRIPADGSNPSILNQPGAGGSTAWAELDTHLSVAICHNRQFIVERNNPEFVARLTPIAEAVRQVAAERQN